MEVSQRSWLWILLFAGVNVHMFNYSCLNIAITGMVKLKPNSVNKSYVAVCREPQANVSVHVEEELPSTVGEYDWNPREKSVLMGSFSWFMGVAQLLGALLCQKYGGKKVYFFSNLLLGVLSCLIPLAATVGLKVLIAVRCLQGIAGGSGNGVAVKTLISKWVPPNERAKFVSVMAGLYCGTSLSYYVNGWIMYFIGWRAVFYAAGVLSFVWCTLWRHFVYENPKDSPRISLSELAYIEQSIGVALSQKKLPVPWIRIFTSVPVLANTAATVGMTWLTFTFLIYMPSYLQEIHGYSFYKIGQFSSIPYLLETVFTIWFAVFTDRILRMRVVSLTTIRKCSMIFSTFVSGTLIFCLLFGGCDIIIILALLGAAIMFSGVSFAVVSANVVDISPNFCAVIHGLQSVLCQSMGFVSPLMVAYFTGAEKSLSQWNKVFLTTSVICLLSGLLFAVFGDSTVQPWNYEYGREETEERRGNELLPMQKSRIVIVSANKSHK